MPRPKKIFSSEGSESVEVRRLGGIYWIYMEALPSKTWPLMKDYLFDNQYNLVSESPESGKNNSREIRRQDVSYIGTWN